MQVLRSFQADCTMKTVKGYYRKLEKMTNQLFHPKYRLIGLLLCFVKMHRTVVHLRMISFLQCYYFSAGQQYRSIPVCSIFVYRTVGIKSGVETHTCAHTGIFNFAGSIYLCRVDPALDLVPVLPQGHKLWHRANPYLCRGQCNT